MIVFTCRIVQGVAASNFNLNSPTQNFLGEEFFSRSVIVAGRTPQRRLALFSYLDALDALRSRRMIGCGGVLQATTLKPAQASVEA